ncbi:MAG TPA: hypothetical protein VH374_06395 [Polyangia bacterium]|nr:hypothetical protein [Polyangia bacterium]
MLVVALAMTASLVARADDEQSPPELTLSWRAPADCPSAADVEGQFARLLGGVRRKPSPKHLDATATVTRTRGDTWSVQLRTMLDGVPGQRTLEGDSCWTVASAASLILALTIDPNAVIDLPQPLKAPSQATPQAPDIKPLTRAPLPAPSFSWQPFARAFGGVTLALLPEPALTGGLAAGLRRGRWRAELSALGTEERQHTTADRPAAGGNFRLWAGGARACGDGSAAGGVGARIFPRLCAGGEVERLTGRGFGVSAPMSNGVTIGAGTVDGVLVWLLTGRVELGVNAGFAGRPYHPTFRLGNVGDVFAVPAISWAAGFSVGVSL